ncbi:hypothetical protein [Geoalkalibacter sp.]|uniref:hypothetical protein n=1 Tax=Geoalkalibacter sp. TaxID=3041440 RepID=UPI00272DE795|nr:hypothetical protein [Geoalkalibacter sp.]
MLTRSAGNTALAPTFPENTCPFLREESRTCSASFSVMSLDQRKRRTLCQSEDFDDCALFLSRLLRRNRPSCGLDPWTVRDK